MAGGQRRPTLRDVATMAGVAIGTASDALHDNRPVRPETRARVREVARQLNYVPNRNATRLLDGRSDCIGVVFRSVISEAMFYSVVMRGMVELFEEQGYTVRMIHLDKAGSLSPSFQGRRRPLNAQDIDGLIVLNWQDAVLMDRLRNLGIPLVAVDTSGGHPDILSVDNDDRQSVSLGIEYLIHLGHHRIALLNDVLTSPFGREALAGYLQTFESHELTVEPGLLRTSQFSIAAGRVVMGDLLSGKRPPTAVFAVDDLMAIGAMQAIQDAGLTVPRDISVVGRNDIALSAEVHPALTTVRMEKELLGRRAAEMLLQAIGGSYPETLRLVLPAHLVVRASATSPTFPGAEQ